MKVAIITTGDEIMAGNVVDTNASWLSDQCWKIGAKVVWRYTVTDEASDIGEACRLASQKADIVLVTGGLGPTVDDITLSAAAKAFGKKLECREAVLKEIERFFKRVGREMSESNKKQAFLPEGGEALPNKVGTAPGCEVQFGKATFYFFPGVPAELYPMFEEIVLPHIKEKWGEKIIYREKILKLFGAPEATLDTKLKGVDLGKVRLSFRVHFPEIWLKLACWGENQPQVEEALGKATQNVYARVGDYIYGEGEESLSQVIGKLLKKKKATLAVGESCTGGFLANQITDISGASDYFERGVVTYSNQAKEDILGISKETLKKFGAVSEQMAKEMAKGVREKSGATYGLSITGIAGPTGGTKEKPVGTIYIGLATPKKIEVQHFRFERSRLEFKQLVSATALNWLRKVLL